MCGEALQRGRAHRTIHQIGQVVEESPSRDCRSMSGHVVVVSLVPHRERLLQDLSDARRPGRTRMIALELATRRSKCARQVRWAVCANRRYGAQPADTRSHSKPEPRTAEA